MGCSLEMDSGLDIAQPFIALGSLGLSFASAVVKAAKAPEPTKADSGVPSLLVETKGDEPKDTREVAATRQHTSAPVPAIKPSAQSESKQDEKKKPESQPEPQSVQRLPDSGGEGKGDDGGDDPGPGEPDIDGRREYKSGATALQGFSSQQFHATTRMEPDDSMAVSIRLRLVLDEPPEQRVEPLRAVGAVHGACAGVAGGGGSVRRRR